MRQAVVFDLDGTLVDTTSIQHLVAPSHPDYTVLDVDTFNARTMFCPPRREVLQQLESERYAGRGIIIITSRPTTCESISRSWLDGNVGWVDEVHHRDGGQWPHLEYKLEKLAEVRSRWDVVRAWDDDPYVVKAFRLAGTPTVLVPGWLP